VRLTQRFEWNQDKRITAKVRRLAAAGMSDSTARGPDIRTGETIQHGARIRIEGGTIQREEREPTILRVERANIWPERTREMLSKPGLSAHLVTLVDAERYDVVCTQMVRLQYDYFDNPRRAIAPGLANFNYFIENPGRWNAQGTCES
jgi:hypothetical protein